MSKLLHRNIRHFSIYGAQAIHHDIAPYWPIWRMTWITMRSSSTCSDASLLWHEISYRTLTFDCRFFHNANGIYKVIDTVLQCSFSKAIDMRPLKQYIHMTLQLKKASSISRTYNYILYRLRQLRTELGMNHKRSHFLYWHIKSMSMNN